MAVTVFVLSRFTHVAQHDASRFVILGSAFVDPHALPRGVYVFKSSAFDGQFYYRVALAPFNFSARAFGIRLDDAYRMQRITYPVLSWLGAGGRPTAVPASLIAVNILGMTALGILGGMAALRAGRHSLWGLLFPGFFGTLTSLSRDLGEITEAVFVLAGLLVLRRGRPWLAAACLTAAVLTRETATVVPFGMAIVWLVERLHQRRRNGTPEAPGRAALDELAGAPAVERLGGVVPWVGPLVALGVWVLVVRVFGSDLAFSGFRTNIGWPLYGLVQGARITAHAWPHEIALLWTGGGLLLAYLVFLGARKLRVDAVGSIERASFALAVLLALILAKAVWGDFNDFRVFGDVWTLGLLITFQSRSKMGWLASAAGVFWAIAAYYYVFAL